MKKSSTALAALVAAAGLAGATTVSAQAFPAQAPRHTLSAPASKAASARLHTLLETGGSTAHHSVRVDDWGAVSH